MDDILKNIYVDSMSPDVIFGKGDAAGYANMTATTTETTIATANDVWREIGVGAGMTLEDYLSKAGVGGNGSTEIASVGTDLGVFGGVEQSPGLVIGNGRGKRKAVVQPVVNKATQQKQKRMIKNRESAGRFRERKQQYRNELEKQVMQLEEERAQFLREEVVEYSTSKTSKHGHAQCHFVAMDIFTGKKLEDIVPSPTIVIIRNDLKLPTDDDLLTQDGFAGGKDLVVAVMSSMEEDQMFSLKDIGPK